MKAQLFQWGGEVAFDVIGQGRDALLCSFRAVFDFHRSEMHPLTERLAVDIQCRIPDWSGFGMSPHAGRPATAVVAALKLDADLVILSARASLLLLIESRYAWHHKLP